MSVLWISVDDRASCLCRLWGRAELWDENSSLRCGKKRQISEWKSAIEVSRAVDWWSKQSWSLFPFIHPGELKNIYIFQKRHIRNIRDRNLTCWHFNDRLIAGGRIGGIKGMSPGSATISPPQTTARLVSFADFCFRLFPQLRSLVPGCKNCCSNIYSMCIFYRVVWLY